MLISRLVLIEAEPWGKITDSTYMREYDSHGTTIKNSLHEPVTALVWHTDEWRDSREERCRTQPTHVLDGKDGVFKINKYRIIASGFS